MHPRQARPSVTRMHEDRTKEVMKEQESTSSSRAGWALLGLAAAFIAAAAFLVRGAPTSVPGLEVATAEDVVDASLWTTTTALVGALILARQPRNLFGWAFLLVALCFEASLFAGAYSTYGTFTHPGSLPAPQLLSLVERHPDRAVHRPRRHARAAALPNRSPADEALVDRRCRRGCVARARDHLDGDPPGRCGRGCSRPRARIPSGFQGPGHSRHARARRAPPAPPRSRRIRVPGRPHHRRTATSASS